MLHYLFFFHHGIFPLLRRHEKLRLERYYNHAHKLKIIPRSFIRETNFEPRACAKDYR